MIPVTFEIAWKAYLDAQHQMPAPPPAVEPLMAGGLLEAAQDFDVIVFDSYGTLHSGGKVFPESLRAYKRLRKLKKKLLLTNDGSGDKPTINRRATSRGFEFKPDNIIAGIDLLESFLREGPVGNWGVIGSWGPPFRLLMRGMPFLETDPDDYDAVDCFIFLDADTWTGDRQKTLAKSLEIKQRPVIVCNPDIACPHPAHMSAEPGLLINHAYENGPVRFFGKPYHAVFDRLRARYPDVPADRFLVVGDTLHTDILSARAAGMKAMLVKTGFMGGRDPYGYMDESGIWPDFITDQL